MGWTICQPSPNWKQARKVYKNNLDVSDFAFAEANIDTNQILQDEETLSLDLLYQFLSEVDQDNDNVFLMRGKPFQPERNILGLESEDWLDCSSRQFQLDLDFSVRQSKFTQAANLEERVEIALEELPFLRNCGFIAQLSSSAGFAKTKKADRLNLRLWVETTKAYTGAELLHHLKPHLQLIDHAMFQPNRRHYIRRSESIQSDYLLDNKPHLFYQKGGALSLDEISGNVDPYVPKEAKKPSLKTQKDQKKTKTVIKAIYNTNRDCLIDELEAQAAKGHLEGNRNEIFSELFRKEALYNSGDCGLLIDQIMRSPPILGDRTLKNLKAWEKLSAKKVLDTLTLSAESFRRENFHSIHNFHEIDLAKRDWSALLTNRASAIQSCMGTNKTKGVIYDIVRHAIKNDKSVLIVAPLVAVTEQIANDVGISHYHTLGEHRAQRKELLSKAQRLAVCYKSLELYSEIGTPKFDYVIVDEASEVFRNWADQTDNTIAELMLQKIMDESKHCIIMDAHIDDSLCLWGLSRIANFAAETSALFYNSASYLEGYEINMMHDYGLTLLNLVKAIKSGQKTAIFVDWKDESHQMTALTKWIEKLTGKKGKNFDTEQVRARAPELKRHPNKTISDWMKKDELDFLMVSPWCNCGWDYLERGFDFDEIFVISTASFFSSQKILQMLRRMRLTRKGTIYLSNRSQPPWKDEIFKLVKDSKGKDRADLTREEEWEIRKAQAHLMDLKNVPWVLREKLKNKRAIIREVFPDESEILKGEEILSDWKKFKTQIIKELAKNDETDLEKAQRVLSNFKRAHKDHWVDLREDKIDQDDLQALIKRDKKLDAPFVDRLLFIFQMDKEERKELDQKEILGFNLIIGELMEDFWNSLQPIISMEDYIAFEDWYSNPESEPILGDFDDVSFDFLKAYSYVNQRELKYKFQNIGIDKWNEPARMIRPLFNSFDLQVTTTTEMKKLPIDLRVGATQAKRNLFEHYEMTKEPGYDHRKKINFKNSWCLEHIKEKQAKGTTLHHHEKIFLMSKPKFFEIKRKTFTSKKWLDGLTKAKQIKEDKLGIAFHHTKFCSCFDCTELAAINS